MSRAFDVVEPVPAARISANVCGGRARDARMKCPRTGANLPGAGHPALEDDMASVMKRCTSCKRELPLEDFNRRGHPDIRRAQCRDCTRRRDREADARRTKGERRARELWSKYKLTAEDYDARLAAQGGQCALCGVTEPGGHYEWFVVDHDHDCCASRYTCGRCVRGLLCLNCNRFVGFVESERGQRVLTYLSENSLPNLYLRTRA